MTRAGPSVRHIVFVNRYFYPDESATSQILSDLAFHLTGEGYQVSVVTSRLSYGGTSQTFAAREQIDGVDVHRIWTTKYNRKHLVGRSIDFFSFYVSAIAKLLQLSNRGTLVVLKTDPPMLATAVGPFLRLKGARYCNWLQDLFPEVAAAAGLKVADGVPGVLLKKLRNRSLKHAQMNIVIGDRMRQRLVEAGVQPEIIKHIPNWSAGENVQPLAPADNPLREQWGLKNEFVVGYSGNFGRVHEFQTLLDAASSLLPYPRIKFVLIGQGVKQQEVEELARNRNLTNVLFKPFQPRSQLQESLGVADVHIVSLLPSMEGLVVPSKTYGIAAAGRPVIFVGDRNGEIAKLLEFHDCGFAVSIGDSIALTNTVKRLADDPDYCARLGQNARLAFDGSYSDEVALAKWSALFNEYFNSKTS